MRSGTETHAKIPVMVSGAGTERMTIFVHLENVENVWKISDIEVIEGVSLRDSYKNWFQETISRVGVAGMISALKAKNLTATHR